MTAVVLYCRVKRRDNKRDFWGLLRHYGNIVFWHHCFPTISSKPFSVCVLFDSCDPLSQHKTIFFLLWTDREKEKNNQQGPLWNSFHGILILVKHIWFPQWCINQIQTHRWANTWFGIIAKPLSFIVKMSSGEQTWVKNKLLDKFSCVQLHIGLTTLCARLHSYQRMKMFE